MTLLHAQSLAPDLHCGFLYASSGVVFFGFLFFSRESFLCPLLCNRVCGQRLLLEALLLVKMIWFLLCIWVSVFKKKNICCCAAESGISLYLHFPQVFLDYLDEGMPSPMRVEDSPHTRKRKSAWVVPKHMVRNPR